MIGHLYTLLRALIAKKAFGVSNVMSGRIGHWVNAEIPTIKQLWDGKHQMSMYFQLNEYV